MRNLVMLMVAGLVLASCADSGTLWTSEERAAFEEFCTDAGRSQEACSCRVDGMEEAGISREQQENLDPSITAKMSEIFANCGN